jgi:hypothetical protein
MVASESSSVFRNYSLSEGAKLSLRPKHQSNGMKKVFPRQWFVSWRPSGDGPKGSLNIRDTSRRFGRETNRW